MRSQLAKDNLYMKMVVNIMHVGNLFERKASNALKQFDITHVQFNVLRILELRSPDKLSVAEISDGLFFATSDVSRIIDRLVKRNLVKREICENNRRKVDLSITDEGLLLIQRALPDIENSMKGYYKNIVSNEERDLMLDILKKLKQ